MAICLHTRTAYARVASISAKLLISLSLVALFSLPLAAELRVATFRADATTAPGEPLIWLTPTAKVEDPLWIKGVIIADGSRRYVICSLDWCGIGSSIHDLFRAKIAHAVRTNPAFVAVQSVHQHAAPYVDGDANTMLRRLGRPPGLMSEKFLQDLTDRIAAAAEEAVKRLQPFDSVGVSAVNVERVASARRIIGEDGKVIVRYSGSGKDPKMAALPEGAIDPKLRTITLAKGGKPLVRLHFYATHPQTFCCDGRASADFVSAAREAVEKETGVFQIYFTGCSGDVTVGKYNDGSDAARAGLAARLKSALAAAPAATRFAPAGKAGWRSADLLLEPKPVGEAQALLNDPAIKDGVKLYRAAQMAAFAARKRPLVVNSLDLGPAAILMLPGEPMLEFQRFAVGLASGKFLAVAGYGDLQPGYLCTDRAFIEGGYEPSASNSASGSEARIKTAIRQVLGK
ncbi:MAG: hypothetical protein ABFD89_02260 [Bryobacteraceae bacterium]